MSFFSLSLKQVSSKYNMNLRITHLAIAHTRTCSLNLNVLDRRLTIYFIFDVENRY
jgi:hypothetical protein